MVPAAAFLPNARPVVSEKCAIALLNLLPPQGGRSNDLRVGVHVHAHEGGVRSAGPFEKSTRQSRQG